MKSAQPQQPEKRKKEDRSKQAKAGGGAAAQTKKKSSSPNKTPILLIAVLLVCGGAGALAYVLLQGSRYLPPECNSDGTSKVEQPVTIGMCRSAVCSFEVSKCTQPCPFGYLKESLSSACAKSCVCASEGQFQGDVQIDNEEIPKLLEEFGYIEEEETEFSLFVGSAIKGWNPKFTWKAKIKKDTGRLVIGYTMTDDLKSSAKTRKAFQDAFKSYKEDSCIDFEPYDKNKHIPNKIAFKKGKGCWSYVGMKDPKRGNPVSIGKGCDHPQTVMHELLHALGFLHEQSRPDRDNFVTVNLQNVFKNFEGNFVKAKAEHMIDLKSPYDFKSIMHYNGFSFSKNRQPTLTKKDTGAAVTNPKPVNKLGGEDLKELNTLFCENAKPSTGGGTTTASPRTTRQPVITTRAPVVPTTRRPLVTTKKWPYTTRSPATTRATTRTPWRPNPTTRATTRAPWRPNPTTRATTRK
uniref:Metalloendopeptidase n=1 Tax=Ciona savignyi TaxID=51511 RepID=H2ZMX9_CIOSA